MLTGGLGLWSHSFHCVSRREVTGGGDITVVLGLSEVHAQEEEVSVLERGLQELISDRPKFEHCWGRWWGAGQLSRRLALCLCPGVLLIVSDRLTSQLLCPLCREGEAWNRLHLGCCLRRLRITIPPLCYRTRPLASP